MPTTRVLLLNELDGDVVIDISSDKAFESVALAIVKQRLNAGFYPMPPEPSEPELTVDKAAKLKLPEPVRVFVRSQWANYRDELAKFIRESYYHKTASAATETGDGETAVQLLESRQGFEGESFKILEVRESY